MVGRHRRYVVALLLTVVALVVPASAGATVPVTPSWQSGPLVESQDFNCITGDVEQEAGAYMSYYADPSNPPKVGDTFYVAIDLTGIGNTCAGIYADVNLVLPSGLSLAIDGTHPLYCYLGFPGASSYSRDTQDCPQSLPLGPYGYSLDPVHTNPPFYPLPQGGTVEIQVPVKSSVAGTVQFGGYVQLADGDLDPTLGPRMYAVIDPATAVTQTSRIGIFYQTPSISSQSEPGGAGHAVQANFVAYVENNSNPGTVSAEVAKADAAGDCTNPTHVYTITPATNLQIPQTQLTGNFTGIYPGAAYCWRLKATVTSGPQAGEYDGNWQYFETIGTYFTPSTPDPNEPPPAHPLHVAQCSTNGSGCQTSNCNTPASCTSTGSLGGLGHTVSIALAGSGSGTVTGPGGISCPGTCSRVYPAGASNQVTLTAAPSAGSTFAGWSGGGCSGTSTCTVSETADHNVTATFTLIPKPLPTCSLSAVTSKVLVRRPKHGHPSIPVGELAFKVACNQTVSLSLTAALKESLGKRHGKPVFKTFNLGPAHGSVTGGASTLLYLKLPHAALAALGRHIHESLVATVTASDANGLARASASLGKLSAKR